MTRIGQLRRARSRRRARAITLAMATILVAVSVTVAQVELASQAHAAPGAVMPGFNSTNLPGNDDGSTGLVTLPFTLKFFGQRYSSLYVNNNGNVTFTTPLGIY